MNGRIAGKVAVKLHTGEQYGPNIIPSAWVKRFMADELPDATIIETNTFYEGDRDTTEKHRETLNVNGWDFCPVDITDEFGTTDLPVKGGKWLRVAGPLKRDERVEAKKHMLDSYPSLQAMYSAEDDNTEVLYFTEATATFSSFTEAPRTGQF